MVTPVALPLMSIRSPAPAKVMSISLSARSWVMVTARKSPETTTRLTSSASAVALLSTVSNVEVSSASIVIRVAAAGPIALAARVTAPAPVTSRSLTASSSPMMVPELAVRAMVPVATMAETSVASFRVMSPVVAVTVMLPAPDATRPPVSAAEVPCTVMFLPAAAVRVLVSSMVKAAPAVIETSPSMVALSEAVKAPLASKVAVPVELMSKVPAASRVMAPALVVRLKVVAPAWATLMFLTVTPSVSVKATLPEVALVMSMNPAVISNASALPIPVLADRVISPVEASISSPAPASTSLIAPLVEVMLMAVAEVLLVCTKPMATSSSALRVMVPAPASMLVPSTMVMAPSVPPAVPSKSAVMVKAPVLAAPTVTSPLAPKITSSSARKVITEPTPDRAMASSTVNVPPPSAVRVTLPVVPTMPPAAAVTVMLPAVAVRSRLPAPISIAVMAMLWAASSSV